jgi:hypothetical protein
VRSRWVSEAGLHSRRFVGWIAVGLIAGSLTVGFRQLLHVAYRAILGTSDVLSGVSRLAPWLCVGLPALGCGVAAGLVGWARRGNQGVGGVLEAVALGRGRISFRASLARAVACFAAVGERRLARAGGAHHPGRRRCG